MKDEPRRRRSQRQGIESTAIDDGHRARGVEALASLPSDTGGGERVKQRFVLSMVPALLGGVPIIFEKTIELWHDPKVIDIRQILRHVANLMPF